MTRVVWSGAIGLLLLLMIPNLCLAEAPPEPPTMDAVAAIPAESGESVASEEAAETEKPAEEQAEPVDPAPAAAPTAPIVPAVALPPALEEEPETEIEVEVCATHEWPAQVETITAEQVEEMVNASFIGDVVERVPGADTLNGCLMGAQLITVRGNNSEWTELVLEGMPLNPLGRPYLLSFLPMSGIETVRILKGPVPPKYCGSTIAGLVLMDMKTGDRYPGTQVGVTVGDYGQRIVDVTVGGGVPSRNYFLSFTKNQTDGWMPHSEMDFTFFSGKFVLCPDPQSRLTLVAADTIGEKNGPRPLGPNPVDKWEAEWTDLEQPKASLTYERQVSDRSDIMLRLVATWFSGVQTWTQWFTDHEEERFMPWEYDLFRGEFQHNLRITEERIWTWGASWQKDRYEYAGPLRLSAWDNIPANSWREYVKRGTSLYGQYSQPTNNTGVITLGARYDSEEPGQSITSPFVSWNTPLNAGTRLRLAVTRNRRFPTLVELYGQGVWTGNPALQPELGWTSQADLSWCLPRGAVEFTVFNSQLEDIVVANDENVFSNLGEARLRGVEVSYQGSWCRGNVWANYSYLDAEDTQTGEPLIAAFRTAVPKHSAKFGVSLKDSHGGEQALEVLAYGRRRTDVDEPTYVGAPWFVTVPPSLPGFTWVNYQYSWPLRDSGKLTLAVENVFDIEAQDLLFYPRPGRWVSGSLTWHF